MFGLSSEEYADVHEDPHRRLGNPHPVEDGYTGLQTLAESEFSGVITTGESTLFMLNGRGVGLSGSSIESFKTASLAAARAPHPALSLLFAMQAGDGETAATYYTNNTAIDETKSTLEAGGFTGYIELSENVLSGDYFEVYHQGRSMSAAFVGAKERLITDEEAETRMREEVGIYTVETVDIDEITIPEPPTGSFANGETPNQSGDSDRSDESVELDNSEAPDEPDETVDQQRLRAENSDSTELDNSVSVSDTTEEAGTREQVTTCEQPSESPLSASDGSDEPTENELPAGGSTQSTETAEPTAPRERWGSVIDDPVEDRILAEQQWRETNRIPSIDPERSTMSRSNDAPAQKPHETTPEPGEELLARALDALETEREAREATEKTVAKLQEEVSQLETKLASADETPISQPATESLPVRSLDPQIALSGTQLFVRYESKGDATIETAHAGDTDREALASNLRLERHTEFDSTNVAVDKTSFEAFLSHRLEYQFAEWLVSDLVFELNETGHAGSLGALYDSLPSIDRIEFQAQLSEEDEHSFGVICRDRMGEVLFVIDCIDRREATTEEQVASLVERATVTTEGAPDLAGAMMVTTSYFDPSALSTASEATRSGLFGGGSRESYVTISRRAGYHLCLVETHDGAFHLSVPEL